MNTYSGIHDFNTHFGSRRGLVGYVDIFTPMWGYTHNDLSRSRNTYIEVESLNIWYRIGTNRSSTYNPNWAYYWRDALQTSKVGNGMKEWDNWLGIKSWGRCNCTCVFDDGTGQRCCSGSASATCTRPSSSA